MGLGILDDKRGRQVPGTATLEDLQGRGNAIGVGPNVKRTAGGIILVPQPTDDPDDPLNWPLWQRDLITFILCILSVLAATLSPLLAANTIVLDEWFGGLSIIDASLLTGYHLLGVGVSGPLFVAMARVWGKRHLLVLAPIIIIISSIWGGCAGHSYKSLIAARFFQGVGLAPFEGLVNAAVGEMYHVHESGKRLALTNLCLFGGAFFTPVIVGRMTLEMGWQWPFWFIAIFTTAATPFVYLFCAETTFHRPSETDSSTVQLADRTSLETQGAAAGTSPVVRQSTSLPSFTSSKAEASVDAAERAWTSSTSDNGPSKPEENIHRTMPRKMITRHNLRLFSGRKSPESVIQLALRPFPLFLHVGILWSCLVQGAMIAWTTLLGISLALIMLDLSFNEAETGYMYAGAFIGALVAFGVAGLVADPAARWLTGRNRGIFEPEFRMVLVIPMAMFAFPGLYGFGYTAARPSFGWLPPDVFFGFVVAGMTLGAIVSAQYIVDAYRDITVEGFTCLLVFKNLLTFSLLFRGLDWYLEAGAQKLFFSIGYVQVGICLTTVPMYIFGKRIRSFYARYDILRILRLK